MIQSNNSYITNSENPFLRAAHLCKKGYNKISNRHAVVSTVVTTSHDLFTSVAKIVHIVRPLQAVSVGVNLFTSTDLLFAPVRLAVNIKAVVTEQSCYKKVKAVFESVKETAVLALDVLGLVSALKTVGLVSANAISWTGIVGPILVPVLSITLPFSAYELYTLNKMRRVLQNVYKRPEKCKTEEQRVENAVRGLEFVQKNHKSVQDTLSISKKAAINKKVNDLLDALKQSDGKEKALADADQFLLTLRSRVRTATAYEAVSLVANIASFILTVVAFGVSSTAPPVLPVMGAVTAVGLIALLGIKYLMLQKNPFTPKSNAWHARVLTAVQDAVSSTTYGVYKATKFVTIKPVKQVVAVAIQLPRALNLQMAKAA